MQAKDIMTTRVLTIGEDNTVVEAADLMLKNRISGLPVVDSRGTLVGMLTEGDLLRRAETQTERRRPRWLEFVLGPGRAAEEFTRSHGRKVGQVMSRHPYSVTEDTSLEEIVAMMERHRIKRVPVLRGDKIVGIVSRANLVNALASIARFAPTVASSDRDIRSTILSRMEEAVWAPAASVNVTVNDGVVEFWGAILDERDRTALKVLAENVPGVKRVVDHMVWVEPCSGMVLESQDDLRTKPTSTSVSSVG